MYKHMLAAVVGLSCLSQANALGYKCQDGEVFLGQTLIQKNPQRGCYQNGDLTAVVDGYEYCVSNLSAIALEGGKQYNLCALFEEEQLTVTRAGVYDGLE
jgi:hypothetical protein